MGRIPLRVPLGEQTVPPQDILKRVPIDRARIEKAGHVLAAPAAAGLDGGRDEVLRPHDADGNTLIVLGLRPLHCFIDKVVIGRQELYRNPVDEDMFRLCAEPELLEPGVYRGEDDDRPGRRR
jgi:hypothetical protein